MPVTAITAGASIAKGAIGAAGANSAANAAKTAASQAIGFDKGVYSDAQQNLNPVIQSGQNSTGILSGLINGNSDAFNKYLNSTNYKFQLDQGLKGVASANAPSFNSGATGKALNNYAQGQAGSALAGYEGLLQGQQTTGTQAALGLGALGNQTGSLVGNALGFGANAAGAASNAGAAFGGGILSDLTGQLNQAHTASSFGGGSAGTNINSSGPGGVFSEVGMYQ
jgi:hypothetical protein